MGTGRALIDGALFPGKAGAEPARSQTRDTPLSPRVLEKTLMIKSMNAEARRGSKRSAGYNAFKGVPARHYCSSRI